MASFVALIFVACGGGSKPTHHDGGADDGGGHIQFDAQRDGLQQDAQGDTGTQCGTTCDPSGGAQTGALCKCNSDCNCGSGGLNACQDPWPTETDGHASSCWKTCTSAGECSGSEPYCLGITTSQGACVPQGTISGTFADIPSWLDADTPTQALGTASVTMAVGDINVTFGGGMAYEYTSSSSGKSYWVIDLMPVSGTSPDITKNLMIMIDKTDYGAKTWDLSQSTAPNMQYEVVTISGSSYTSDTLMAINISGTMTLTAAGAGGGAAVTGSITNGVMVKFVIEYCGSHSAPC